MKASSGGKLSAIRRFSVCKYRMQAFFGFERAELPGILLDIDDNTCYDLDQAKEAYAGTFTSQTDLDMDLLGTVVESAENGA
ncbi:MAG: hypothetical protein R6U13_09395 [Desulfatiglandaceae bacterium]